jgi:23S rRNA (cytosine1962-C5)-methyltransferase
MKQRSRLKLETHCPAWTDYELLDSGHSCKLERFGSVILTRPEPQASWLPSRPKDFWNTAAARFVQSPPAKRGEWKLSQAIPDRWAMRRGPLSFWVQLTPSGHVGVFPDQASHWDWLAALISAAPAPPKVLSLFGYTGLATLACAAVGAHVSHVDASHQAIRWARENQELSHLQDRPIRWLVDDASTFVVREIHRRHTYDGLILDPPRFGRGPQGELWKAEDSLPALLRECRKLLSPAPLFVLLNTYTTVLTSRQTAEEATQLHVLLKEMTQNYRANISAGELHLSDSANRRISNADFARATF